MENIFTVGNYFIMIVFAFITFFPFYYIIIYSLSDPSAAQNGLITLWPKGFTLINYQSVFKVEYLANATLVTLTRTVLGTILTLMGCSLFAYGLTKSILPFRKTMYRLLIISMYISSGLIPMYLLITMLHLKNNFLVYVIPSIIAPFFLILIKTYIEQLPPALEEAAMVEGAGYFAIFFKIVLPLCLPIMATIAIFQAVNHWNSWMDNLFFVTDSRLLTLQMLLLNLIKSHTVSATAAATNELSGIKVTPNSIRMTITIVATLPIMIVYPFLQRFFIKGIMLGAVKG
ncbi:sugar ABC transporter permease [Paenibacillus nasutitermitis]|uniref:Sugar ABC transporter permease n=2 Tax=Paenibacillus nasutitermitis TaxID=1652958 RepID=A0A916ZGI4_9BACL|nr:sugar ABC transporter permease [Paenibacillus nasutitermitis]